MCWWLQPASEEAALGSDAFECVFVFVRRIHVLQGSPPFLARAWMYVSPIATCLVRASPRPQHTHAQLTKREKMLTLDQQNITKSSKKMAW